MRNERHDDDERNGMVKFSFDSDDDVRGGFQFTGEKGELRRGWNFSFDSIGIWASRWKLLENLMTSESRTHKINGSDMAADDYEMKKSQIS